MRFAKILAKTATPAGWLSSLLRQMNILKTGRENEISPKELRQLHEQSATLVYAAIGKTLEVLLPKNISLPKKLFRRVVSKSTVYFCTGLKISSVARQHLASLLFRRFPSAEAFDLLMSLEAELIDNAARLDMAINQPTELAEQAIFPISRNLRAKLQ
jgi:hypothetical protein